MTQTVSDPAGYFSETYADAAARFRAAAARHGVAVETWTNPALGPDGERLETQVVELGDPSARNVMVINTGVHGTEALACSAVLTGLLDGDCAFLAERPDFKAVLINIINPYGAAWSRYVNEDNVDVMKNIVYVDEPTPPDPLFMAFDDGLDLPHVRDEGAAERIGRFRRDFVAEHGLERLMASLKKGQSDRPKSLCFNGRGAVWSTRTLNEIVVRTAAQARQVLFVDVHTGVGDYGEAYVIASGDDASKARVKALLGEAAHDSDLVLPKPCYASQGELLPQAQFTAVTIEAGTVDFDDGFRECMWLEMYDHMYGDPLGPRALENQRRFRSYYYPEDPAWRGLWWRNCRAALERLADGMETWRG